MAYYGQQGLLFTDSSRVAARSICSDLALYTIRPVRRSSPKPANGEQFTINQLRAQAEPMTAQKSEAWFGLRFELGCVFRFYPYTVCSTDWPNAKSFNDRDFNHGPIGHEWNPGYIEQLKRASSYYKEM